MFSHFFIERPIFASVLSIVITLAGTVAVLNLPVAQYPPITPPSIMVSCTYPGANAQVVADSVAAPIEQQVNGVENMLYMVSQSNNDGTSSCASDKYANPTRPDIGLETTITGSDVISPKVTLVFPRVQEVSGARFQGERRLG